MRFLGNIVERLRETYANRHEPESTRALVEMYWRFLLLMTAIIVTTTVSYGLWHVTRMIYGPEKSSPISSGVISERFSICLFVMATQLPKVLFLFLIRSFQWLYSFIRLFCSSKTSHTSQQFI